MENFYPLQSENFPFPLSPSFVDTELAFFPARPPSCSLLSPVFIAYPLFLLQDICMRRQTQGCGRCQSLGLTSSLMATGEKVGRGTRHHASLQCFCTARLAARESWVGTSKICRESLLSPQFVSLAAEKKK